MGSADPFWPLDVRRTLMRMAFGGPNPGIWGDSVRKALNHGEDLASDEHAASEKLAKLDAADLRELELSGSYGETHRDDVPTPRRGILSRLFRRSR